MTADDGAMPAKAAQKEPPTWATVNSLRKQAEKLTATLSGVLELVCEYHDHERLGKRASDFAKWLETEHPSVIRENPTAFFKIIELLVDFGQTEDGKPNKTKVDPRFAAAASDSLVAVVRYMVNHSLPFEKAVVQMMVSGVGKGGDQFNRDWNNPSPSTNPYPNIGGSYANLTGLTGLTTTGSSTNALQQPPTSYAQNVVAYATAQAQSS